MGRKHGKKKIRRHYFRLMHMSFEGAIWFVNVVFIPWCIMSAVAFAQFACLVRHEISGKETNTIAAGGTGAMGLGTLIFAAISNHHTWAWYTNRKPFGVIQVTRLVFLSLFRNICWIGAGLLFFAYSSSFVAGFKPEDRDGPLMTCFLLSALAGFFAFLLVSSLASYELNTGPTKSFRGRSILSGKDKAKKLASKKRWSI